MSNNIYWSPMVGADYTAQPGEWTDYESRNDGPAFYLSEDIIIEADSKAQMIELLEAWLARVRETPEVEPVACVHCGGPMYFVPPERGGLGEREWVHQWGGGQWSTECYVDDPQGRYPRRARMLATVATPPSGPIPGPAKTIDAPEEGES